MVPPPSLVKGFAHTKKIMTGNDGGVSCASCVMVVMAMTVNCGGDDGVIDDDNVYARPRRRAPFTGPLESMFSGLLWDRKTGFRSKCYFFLCFSRKLRQADRRRRLRATITTQRQLQMAPRTPQIIPSPPPLLVLFVLLGFRLGIRACGVGEAHAR